MKKMASLIQGTEQYMDMNKRYVKKFGGMTPSKQREMAIENLAA